MKHPNVTFEVTIESEDIPVRGNCMASGDDAFDKKCEDEILERLENGDDSAWCCVKVTARTAGGFEGFACIGGCTLSDDYTAEQCAEEHGLRAEALDNLRTALKNTSKEGKRAAELLKDLGQ